ncbi:MAG: hypothetical protein ABIE14_02215 [Patescibacteria group bacterium]
MNRNSEEFNTSSSRKASVGEGGERDVDSKDFANQIYNRVARMLARGASRDEIFKTITDLRASTI